MVRILGGCDSGRQVILKVDAILSVGIMDRCVLCRTWAHNLCLWWSRPESQAVHTSAELHGFGLIPVSVSEAGVQVGGGVEQKEVKPGTPRSDMAC